VILVDREAPARGRFWGSHRRCGLLVQRTGCGVLWAHGVLTAAPRV
jgi:hypothetical protein